jgi:glucosamine kinase
MILLADAGNTKTDWRLITSDGNFTPYRTAGISPYFESGDQIRKVVEEVSVQLAADRPERVIYYGTGCSLPEQAAIIHSHLAAHFPGARAVEVLDDLTGAGVALFGDRNGVAVITGTGSNAGVMSGGKITRRIRSLGYLLGDEGSGAVIGFGFLKALLSDQLPAAITKKLLKEMGATPQELLRTVYAAPKPQTFAASCLRYMIQYRDLPEIRNIVTNAFDNLLNVMVLPLYDHAEQRAAGFAGSVAAMFEEELRETFAAGGVEVASVLQEPIAGLTTYWQNRFSAR